MNDRSDYQIEAADILQTASISFLLDVSMERAAEVKKTFSNIQLYDYCKRAGNHILKDLVSLTEAESFQKDLEFLKAFMETDIVLGD